MVIPAPYLYFCGDAADAIAFYAAAFSAEPFHNSFADFGRSDGEPGWIAHGGISGSVSLFCSDGTDALQRGNGIQLALLGTDAAQIRRWFDALSVGAQRVRPLEQQPWGDWDGEITDRFGVSWLLGFVSAAAAGTGT